jgi:hypothetical protein
VLLHGTERECHLNSTGEHLLTEPRQVAFLVLLRKMMQIGHTASMLCWESERKKHDEY